MGVLDLLCRCADLSGISEQLDKPGVKKITQILQAAKSSYVNPFNKLSGQIKVKTVSTLDTHNCNCLVYDCVRIPNRCLTLIHGGSQFFFKYCVGISINRKDHTKRRAISSFYTCSKTRASIWPRHIPRTLDRCFPKYSV